jgi:hypothetical protein
VLTVPSLIGLAIAVALVIVALCASHIPGLRHLTGAAPLLPEEAEIPKEGS